MSGLFFTFFHRCSIGLKSGEYDGNGSIVKRSCMRLEKVLHGLAGMIASAILNHHDVTSRLGQHVEQKGRIALGVKPPLMPFGEKPSREKEAVDEAKHLVAFALATGGHFGLLACGGPGVAERAPLGKAGVIAKEQQGFALARVMYTWSDAIPGVWLH